RVQRLRGGHQVGRVVSVMSTVPRPLEDFDILGRRLLLHASPLRANGVQDVAAGGHAQVGAQAGTARVVLLGPLGQTQQRVDGRALYQVRILGRERRERPPDQ